LILDEFVVMPNHFHAVLVISPYEILGAGYACDGNSHDGNSLDRIRNSPYCSLQENGPEWSPRKIKPVPELLGAFKTTSSKIIHQSGLQAFRWQKSYHDHIIRNEWELNKIRNYIRYNPLSWDSDIERYGSDPGDIQKYYDDLFKKD
jgi:putative transposase